MVAAGRVTRDARGEDLPGLKALEDADLMIISTRFRQLPDDQYAHLAAFLNAGKPVIAPPPSRSDRRDGRG